MFTSLFTITACLTLVGVPAPNVQRAYEVRTEYQRVSEHAPQRDAYLNQVLRRWMSEGGKQPVRSYIRQHGVYAGAILPVVVDGIDQPSIARQFRAYMRSHVLGQGFSHFGVAVAGKRTAYLFARRVLALDRLPGLQKPNAMVVIEGTLSRKYRRAQVIIARPDGQIDRHRAILKRGRLEGLVPFYGPGSYAVEVLAYGPRGKEVVAIFTARVQGGRQKIRITPPRTRAPAVTDMASALATWINTARKKLGLRPLISDPVLNETATTHARAMGNARVAAHILPGGSSAAQRLALAGIRSPLFFENVAMASSAAQAHAELWGSPSHRRAMLEPSITHMGIGVSEVSSPAGPVLYIVEHFARH